MGDTICVLRENGDEQYKIITFDFDKKNQTFFKNCFGSTCCKAELKYECNDYAVLYSTENDTFILAKSNDGMTTCLSDEDLKDMPELVEYCKKNIEKIKEYPSDLVYCIANDCGNILVPANVKTIATGAAIDCSNVEQISIWPTTELIQKGAFQNCSERTEVFIVENKKMKIEDGAFVGLGKGKIHHLIKTNIPVENYDDEE